MFEDQVTFLPHSARIPFPIFPTMFVPSRLLFSQGQPRWGGAKTQLFRFFLAKLLTWGPPFLQYFCIEWPLEREGCDILYTVAFAASLSAFIAYPFFPGNCPLPPPPRWLRIANLARWSLAMPTWPRPFVGRGSVDGTIERNARPLAHSVDCSRLFFPASVSFLRLHRLPLPDSGTPCL